MDEQKTGRTRKILLIILALIVAAVAVFVVVKLAGDSEDDSNGSPGEGNQAEAKTITVNPDLRSDPCTLLTDAQLQSLSLEVAPRPPGLEVDPERPDCGFRSSDNPNVGLTFLGFNWSGYDSIDDFTEDGFAYFEPVEFEGFRGVYNDVPGAGDFCRLSLEVAEGEVLSAGVSLRGVSDQEAACDLAEKVATSAVATLEEKQG